MMARANPFDVTRAVDFSDTQILEQWVDLPIDGGFDALLRPSSQMPMFIVGGKGSGKTHLLRRMSSLAKLSAGHSRSDILSDRRLGIYLRCEGLDAARFAGKGVDGETWDLVFAYFLDLTLCELCLTTVLELAEQETDDREQKAVCVGVSDLFHTNAFATTNTLAELRREISALRKSVSAAVSNASLVRRIDLSIAAAPARLVFGLPRVLASACAALRHHVFVYLLDELENFSPSQQRYVNELVRANAPPCSIKVGARLYGIHTMLSLSSQEENKEGSEFDMLRLDTRLRDIGFPSYKVFVSRLCARRLFAGGDVISDGEALARVESLFEDELTSRLGDEETAHVVAIDSHERPWIRRLQTYLADRDLRAAPTGSLDADGVVQLVSFPDHPLVERHAVHLLYQEWSSADLVRTAAEIRARARAFIKGEKSREAVDHGASFKHWRSDLLAQVLRDTHRPIVRAGWDSLVRMSFGFPRHLLVLLKHVFGWAAFRGELEQGRKVSLESQRAGIKDASEWFFNDARAGGDDGQFLIRGVARLAEWMREIRMSDKPAHVELCTISVDQTDISDLSKRFVDLATKWSMLLPVKGGRHERNSNRIDLKLQLNPMLAPRWDLSISRRGDLKISREDFDLICAAESNQDVSALIRSRVAGMRGPVFASGPRRRRATPRPETPKAPRTQQQTIPFDAEDS